ncbi:MAG: NifU family protein [Bacteriovoracaceae bacterium]
MTNNEVGAPSASVASEVEINAQPTPNPNALKFIISKIVINTDKATFRSANECSEIPLAVNLFKLRGVDQLHFFQNVITVTKFSYIDWIELEEQIKDTIRLNIDKHNATFEIFDPEKERRKNLSPELLEIEQILDKTIRPGLQGDGGDIQVLSFSNNVIMVKYEGACGTCPSSQTGTLEAIKGIMREQLNNPEIEVYAEPSGTSAQHFY